MAEDNRDDLIQVGRTAGAYGVKGWVRVVPLGRESDLLFETDRWWYLPYPRKPTTREEAMTLKGSLLVSKDDLPELEEGDFYDDEVLGFAVKNLQDEVLGEACGITDNGAQDLLAVRTADGEVFYIPMVEAYLSMIDFEKRLIIVDWSLDWN